MYESFSTPRPRLFMRHGPHPGEIYDLDKDVMIIGRRVGAVDILVNDAEVSTKHARLMRRGGTYILEDLGSTNGTFVNGQRVTSPCKLKFSDVISLGEQIVLIFENGVINDDMSSSVPIRGSIAEAGSKDISWFADKTIDNTLFELNQNITNIIQGNRSVGKSGRKLSVFLCHSSLDKPVVRELYRKLFSEKWIDPWLDEEKLLPGQDWDIEIEKAVESADAVIVCLSNNSVSKDGYVQRELRFVLDIALTKPEETIFIIPLRLNECQPPRRLRAWQYEDYYPKERKVRAYERLLASLRLRANSIGINS